MKKARIFSLLLLAAAALFLCSCGKSNGRVYSDLKVRQYVSEQCPNESYKRISKEKISDDPTHYQYKYETSRGIVFTVDNLRENNDFYGLPVWKKALRCDYRNIIIDLYRADAKAVMEQHDKYESRDSWAYIDCYADIEPLVDRIMMAEAVFEPELEYNTREFLRSLECLYLHIVHYPSDRDRIDHKHWINLRSLYINGSHDRDALFAYIEQAYLKEVKVGNIKDDTVTQEMTDAVHLDQVSNLQLDGVPMKYEIDRYEGLFFALSSDMHAYAYYDENLGEYIMPCDIAVNFESQSIPLIVNEYVTALGGTYSFTSIPNSKEEVYKNTAAWQIGSNEWEMKTRYVSKKGVTRFEIYKNGQKLPIRYLTYEDNERLRTTIMVGIPIDDFVKLFDLEYSVDEYADTVYFTRVDSRREEVVSEESIQETTFKTYSELPDGTWECKGNTYQYRLEITGRMNNAASDSTFVYLSDLEGITLEQAWKAPCASWSLTVS